jgi:hypothetical protein
MADTNPSPRTEAHEPPRHAYDDPTLSPKEFLLAVMHAKHLPIAERIKAAEAVAPYFMPRPGESRYYTCVDYHCKIIIKGIPSDHPLMRQGSTPLSQESVIQDPDGRTPRRQSFSSSASNSSLPHDGDTPTPNIETNTDPPIPDHLTLCTRCNEFVFYPCAKAPLN